MRDQRLDQLADVLVNYSTSVKPGDLVLISGSAIGLPLIEAVHRTVLAAGGHPLLGIQSDTCKEALLYHGTDVQLEFVDPIAQFQIETIDVLIAMWGTENTKAFSNAAPERQAKVSQARKRYLETYMTRAAAGELRWVGTQFPCQASAQDAEMSLSAYADFVFRAGLLHHAKPAASWREISERQQRLADFLNQKETVRFVTPQGTDLTVHVTDRKWINCDGHENFPDGEVFTGPHEDATQGTVRYSFPAVHGGREVDGIQLVFRDGRVVDATAEKGEKFLHAMLDQDDGARCLGEIAIGTNYSIQQYTKNTLFDEKIGGTFHAAVGAAYPETGGKNVSGLHWDMVCDLRDGGEIIVDGEVISRNGKFLDATLPQPG